MTEICTVRDLKIGDMCSDEIGSAMHLILDVYSAGKHPNELSVYRRWDDTEVFRVIILDHDGTKYTHTTFGKSIVYRLVNESL